MDSRRFHQAIGMNNDSDHHQPNSEELDLSLTLGLPIRSIYVPPHQGNPDFINGPYSRLLSQGLRPSETMHVGRNINPIGIMNNAGRINGGGNINPIGMNNAGKINGGGNINPIGMNNAGRINGIAWRPFMTQQYNSNAHQEMSGYSHSPAGYMMNNSNGLVGGQFFMGSSSPSPSPSSALDNDLPAPTMKEYTLLNTSNRRSTAGRKKSNNNSVSDPNKQCSNYNCRTSSTPMWRKGPLGLNTLCNSCGIKYRKECKRKQDEQEMMKELQQEHDPQNNN